MSYATDNNSPSVIAGDINLMEDQIRDLAIVFQKINLIFLIRFLEE
jgi:hypothetical protein